MTDRYFKACQMLIMLIMCSAISQANSLRIRGGIILTTRFAGLQFQELTTDLIVFSKWYIFHSTVVGRKAFQCERRNIGIQWCEIQTMTIQISYSFSFKCWPSRCSIKLDFVLYLQKQRSPPPPAPPLPRLLRIYRYSIFEFTHIENVERLN